MTNCYSWQESSVARSYSPFWLKSNLLEDAFQCLHQQRTNHSTHDATWILSARWSALKTKRLKSWNSGTHLFSPLKRYRDVHRSVVFFEAEDALFLKSLQLFLTQQLTPYLSQRIYHLKGRGGMKALLRDAMKALPNYKYVFKSDVKNFYDSTNHQLLFSTCRSFKVHSHILQLIKQSLGRVEECNAHYQSFQQGIPISFIRRARWLCSPIYAMVSCWYSNTPLLE